MKSLPLKGHGSLWVDGYKDSKEIDNPDHMTKDNTSLIFKEDV